MSPLPHYLGIMVLALLAVVPVSAAVGNDYPPSCTPVPHALAGPQGRIDSLLALHPPAEVAALVGGAGSSYDARYLPHDSLVLLAAGGRRVTISLPPYTTPPGMTESPDGRTVYVVVDTMLWLIDSATGRVEARWRLDLQALGWPAAVAVDGNGRLYIAGQRWTSGLPVAVVEALVVSRAKPPHVLWRSPLGITHAGIWLTTAGHGTIAVYIPDAHDLAGTVMILTHGSGAGATTTMLTSYAVDGPPAAADPMHDRLFLEGTGTVRALSLHRGTPAATATGSAPLALNTSRGLVAFALRDRGVLASESTLRPLALIPPRGQLQGVRALAATPNGSTLWVAMSHSLLRVDLEGCASH